MGVKGLPKVEKVPVTLEFKEFKLSGPIKKDSQKPLTSEELALQECET